MMTVAFYSHAGHFKQAPGLCFVQGCGCSQSVMHVEGDLFCYRCLGVVPKFSCSKVLAVGDLHITGCDVL